MRWCNIVSDVGLLTLFLGLTMVFSLVVGLSYGDSGIF